MASQFKKKKKKKKKSTQSTIKQNSTNSVSYILVAEQIRQQLAAVLERCNQIEKDATEKAEARHREQERKLRGQLLESQKLRMEAEKAKKAAQESYAAAEAARIMADEERQQLLADRSNTTKDLLKELRRHTKYSDDSSDDDGDSRRPAKKKKKSEQSELFTLDGELKVPAPYEGMDMSNLVMHSQIHNDIVNRIANNEFFDLQEMFSGEELTTASSSGTKAKTSKPITKKSEIFFLLYTFGMYYLQRFPHKAAGFLEYLAYLTKFGAPFNVPGLLKLDSALRVHYIKHPDWNWDQNNFTIYRTFDLLSRDPENLIPGQQVLKYNPQFRPRRQQGYSRQPQQAQVPYYQPAMPQGTSTGYSHQQPAQHVQIPPQFQNYPQSVLQLIYDNPRIIHERCKGWNFHPNGCRFTPTPGCVRKHECFICGDRSHKATACPKQRQRGRR